MKTANKTNRKCYRMMSAKDLRARNERLRIQMLPRSEKIREMLKESKKIAKEIPLNKSCKWADVAKMFRKSQGTVMVAYYSKKNFFIILQDRNEETCMVARYSEYNIKFITKYGNDILLKNF